jgi:capsular polysaccharide biosynthesis protein
VSISVVEPALPPFKPEKPRKALNIALSFLLGGVLAVGAAFLLEQTGRTFNTRQDVEQHLGVPVLASIPESEA